LQFGASSIATQKIAVRRELRSRLRGLTPSARAAASQHLCGHLAAVLPTPPGAVVAGFIALPSEPDLSACYRRILAAGGRLAFPLITGPGQMEFRLLPPGSEPAAAPGSAAAPSPDFLPGPHGLWQPDPARCPLVPAAGVHLALVPGLAFAAGGHRLGQGAGYYDRWLAAVPAATPTVGTAFACQLLAGFPVEDHDRRVDFILTEDGWTPGARGLPPPAA
jgi:5-formyltetrahydrofolate cyclo-ligase